MADFIPLSVPYLAGNEWQYIKECLDTGWVSAVGSYVDRFEREFAARAGARFAIACGSGTSALHVALRLVGVGPGDEVIVPTLTFIATANAVTYQGALPTFIDAEPHHLQMDVSKLASFLTEGCRVEAGRVINIATGRRVAAILPVHVVGHPTDMDPVLELAKRFALPVVEDATESLGSTYKGKPTGTLGQLGCFSFNGNKLITTGNGGMIVTDDEVLAKRAKYLTTTAKDDNVEFVHNEIGYNYRLANVLSALGVAQVEQLDAFLAKKRDVAAFYGRELATLDGIGLPRIASWAQPNHWLYTIRVDAKRFGKSSRELMAFLKTRGIETRPLWQVMHRSPAHAASFAWQCEVADVLNAECLSIPCSVGITAEQLQRVAKAIHEARVTSPR